MEKRVLLAIVLTTAVVLLFNFLFPPAPPPERGGPGADTAAVDTARRAAAAETAAARQGREDGREAAGQGGLGEAGREEGEPPPGRPGEAAPREEPPRAADQEPGLFGRRDTAPAGDTVRVVTPLMELRFGTVGAKLGGVTLKNYASYAADGAGEERVQLVREGDALLGWKVAAGPDTLDLSTRSFAPDARELRVVEGDEAAALTFTDSLPEYPGLSFRVTYRFRPDSYRMDVEGSLEGIGARGYTVLTSLGQGLKTNEKNPEDDYGQLEYVVRDRGGDIHKKKLDDVGADDVIHPEGGPYGWVAVRNKYFVVGFIAPERGPSFGGMVVEGLSQDHAARMTASMPVPADRRGFSFQAYMGPQERDRLAAVGQDFQGVNPIGYDWLRFIIRPLADLVTTILTWIHATLGLAYGWVLILFGVMMRVVLFPLYQKSMRAQMQQMQVQPIIEELQDKYEDDPQKLQQEMMRVYKEHNLNPLAGCLPMLLPFPVLITLFFVFKNTIEFRGVPFLWLPDLSLADPYYIIPVIMGLSMFLLQWIGQRGMERNLQMKLMSYGMPVLFTVLFLNFPAGLNLYYATSNMASLPQQLYLSRERQKMKQEGKAG